jgi:hypothetical protein
MAYSPVTIFIATMASAGASASVNLAKSWGFVSVQVSTMTSGAELQQWASVDGTNYYQVFQDKQNTATTANNAFTIASNVGTNGGICPLLPGFQYMKLIATSAPTNGTIFKFICSDS